MDTTEENIKMCKKAKEIQEKHIFVPGDYKAYDEIVSLIESCDSNRVYYHYPARIWIPRQDQLQEMAWDVEIKEDNIDHLLMRFYQLVTSFPDTLHGVYNSSYWTQFRTMEQKWLAFVMKTRFEKIWDGNEWIREKE